MAEFIMMLYGMAAVFVYSGLTTNIKNQRPHSRALVLAGWGVMSFSWTLAICLSLYASYLFVTGMTI